VSPSERATRIATLVDELGTEVDAGLGDGAIAALDPDVARRLFAVAGRLYAVAAEEGAHPPAGTDLTPTESVVLATKHAQSLASAAWPLYLPSATLSRSRSLSMR